MSHENDQHDPPSTARGRKRLLPGRGRGNTRAVVIGAAIIAFGAAPLAYAATGGNLILGERNSANKETEIISNNGATNRNKGGYSTRQSNLTNTGGGAIYGCRATAKTSPNDRKNPCVRANNLSTGLAFEFQATNGLLGGTINVGNGGDSRRPFTTNATGVATGLNADRLDGLHAQDVINDAVNKAVDQAVAQALAKSPPTRWALINAEGQIEAQSGGFTVASGYVGNPAGATDNVYIDAGQDLTNKGITATIALQNQVDQNGDGITNGRAPGADANPEFSGEISATRCAIAGVVSCAPPGTNTSSHLVVSPRMSDGSPTDPDTRKRFYVTVVG